MRLEKQAQDINLGVQRASGLLSGVGCGGLPGALKGQALGGIRDTQSLPDANKIAIEIVIFLEFGGCEFVQPRDVDQHLSLANDVDGLPRMGVLAPYGGDWRLPIGNAPSSCGWWNDFPLP